jgi:hypothetical protein
MRKSWLEQQQQPHGTTSLPERNCSRPQRPFRPLERLKFSEDYEAARLVCCITGALTGRGGIVYGTISHYGF